MTVSTGGTQALDQAMARIAEQGLIGDYYEFGLYRGYTFWYAQKAADQHGNGSMRFFGFDSFEGLPEVEGADRSSGVLFFAGDYSCGREDVERHLRDHGFDWSRAALVEGFFDRSLTDEVKARHSMGPAAIAMIDCDLYQSTVPVLSFLDGLLQEGTVLLFDDWRCFDEAAERGEPRAFREFLAAHPEWQAHQLFDFGTDGRAFTVQRAGVSTVSGGEEMVGRSATQGAVMKSLTTAQPGQ